MAHVRDAKASDYSQWTRNTARIRPSSTPRPGARSGAFSAVVSLTVIAMACRHGATAVPPVGGQAIGDARAYCDKLESLPSTRTSEARYFADVSSGAALDRTTGQLIGHRRTPAWSFSLVSAGNGIIGADAEGNLLFQSQGVVTVLTAAGRFRRATSAARSDRYRLDVDSQECT